MAKLDFNRINHPVLELTMMDAAKTVITVTEPTEGLVEELEKALPELQNITNGKDDASVAASYDLAARFISCNREGIAVTAEDLRSKYWPKDKVANLTNLFLFLRAYMDFIGEINSTKN